MGPTVAHVLDVLAKHYGVPELLEPRTPFALIVWENCAYLVNDARRAQTFEALSERIGIAPVALLGAGVKKIEAAIHDGGMQPMHRAAKVLKCAEVAASFADGDLDATLPALDARSRRMLLKRFPGIADPGADRVLLLCGLAAAPALESNGLRVLERLGFVSSGQPYAAGYRAGVGVLKEARIEGAAAVDAFGLLRAHGRELCKRSDPLCEDCPVRRVCPFAQERG